MCRFLKISKFRGIIDEDTYKNMVTIGSKPGILYGLPKIHKPECHIRPILIAIKTPSYNLKKSLIFLINK